MNRTATVFLYTLVLAGILATAACTDTLTEALDGDATEERLAQWTPEELVNVALDDQAVASWSVGNWTNEDANTRGITRAYITSDEATISVHLFGACYPLDCYWGDERTSQADAHDGRLSLHWSVESFAEKDVEITHLSDTRLEIKTSTRYTDNSGRVDREDTYVLVKDETARSCGDLSPLQQWAEAAPGAVDGASWSSGKWVNEDPNTRSTTRLQLFADENSISAYTWGQCDPVECFPGEATTDLADANDGSLSLYWDLSFKTETMQIIRLSDTRLRIETHSQYTDDSGRADQEGVLYFSKVVCD